MISKSYRYLAPVAIAFIWIGYAGWVVMSYMNLVEMLRMADRMGLASMSADVQTTSAGGLMLANLIGFVLAVISHGVVQVLRLGIDRLTLSDASQPL